MTWRGRPAPGATVIASRTERVIAQAVSSVVDSGTAPSVGTSRAVHLKPTMPFSAAGMRIEPPVSEPRPTKAAPLATETAAPDDDPPGMRTVVRIGRVRRRAVVRIDAHARKGELGHVRAAQQRPPCGAQAGHGGCIGAGRPCAWAKHRRAGRLSSGPAMSNRSLMLKPQGLPTAGPALPARRPRHAPRFEQGPHEDMCLQVGDLGLRRSTAPFRCAHRWCAPRFRARRVACRSGRMVGMGRNREGVERGRACYTRWVSPSGRQAILSVAHRPGRETHPQTSPTQGVVRPRRSRQLLECSYDRFGWFTKRAGF